MGGFGVGESEGRMNHEGYHDPTADRAVKRVDTPERVMDVICMMRSIAHFAGFEVIARIELKDTQTGKEYR